MPFLTLIDEFNKTIHHGSPTIRTFFLVGNGYWPLFLCSLYVLFVKLLGPAFMENRKPFELKNTLIIYNFMLVLLYARALLGSWYYAARYGKYYLFCEEIDVENDIPVYHIASYLHGIYLLKYLEFFDTISLILRKKGQLITNLHVSHHACLPLCFWWGLRAEKTAYQMVPAIINAVVHIIMYSYYGVAACGPRFRRYLWWKQHLTRLQMFQMVLIIVVSNIIVPVFGCKTSRFGLYADLIICMIFFLLFCNFYIKTYKVSKPKVEGNCKSLNGGEVNGVIRNTKKKE